MADIAATPLNVAFPTTDMEPEAVIFAEPKAVNPPVADIDPVAVMLACEVRTRIPPLATVAEAEIRPSAVRTRL